MKHLDLSNFDAGTNDTAAELQLQPAEPHLTWLRGQVTLDRGAWTSAELILEYTTSPSRQRWDTVPGSATIMAAGAFGPFDCGGMFAVRLRVSKGETNLRLKVSLTAAPVPYPTPTP
jgi:hypothetical protein